MSSSIQQDGKKSLYRLLFSDGTTSSPKPFFSPLSTIITPSSNSNNHPPQQQQHYHHSLTTLPNLSSSLSNNHQINISTTKSTISDECQIDQQHVLMGYHHYYKHRGDDDSKDLDSLSPSSPIKYNHSPTIMDHANHIQAMIQNSNNNTSPYLVYSEQPPLSPIKTSSTTTNNTSINNYNSPNPTGFYHGTATTHVTDETNSLLIPSLLDNTKSPADSHDCWKLFTKAKDALPNGARLENLTWRLMHLRLKKSMDDSSIILGTSSNLSSSSSPSHQTSTAVNTTTTTTPSNHNTDSAMAVTSENHHDNLKNIIIDNHHHSNDQVAHHLENDSVNDNIYKSVFNNNDTNSNSTHNNKNNHDKSQKNYDDKSSSSHGNKSPFNGSHNDQELLIDQELTSLENINAPHTSVSRDNRTLGGPGSSSMVAFGTINPAINEDHDTTAINTASLHASENVLSHFDMDESSFFSASLISAEKLVQFNQEHFNMSPDANSAASHLHYEKQTQPVFDFESVSPQLPFMNIEDSVMAHTYGNASLISSGVAALDSNLAPTSILNPADLLPNGAITTSKNSVASGTVATSNTTDHGKKLSIDVTTVNKATSVTKKTNSVNLSPVKMEISSLSDGKYTIAITSSSTTTSGVSCTNCKTTKTPLWRRDVDSNPLCNACGLFLKLHGKVRPLRLKSDVIRKRNRGSKKGFKTDSNSSSATGNSSTTTSTPLAVAHMNIPIAPTLVMIPSNTSVINGGGAHASGNSPILSSSKLVKPEQSSFLSNSSSLLNKEFPSQDNSEAKFVSSCSTLTPSAGTNQVSISSQKKKSSKGKRLANLTSDSNASTLLTRNPTTVAPPSQVVPLVNNNNNNNNSMVFNMVNPEMTPNAMLGHIGNNNGMLRQAFGQQNVAALMNTGLDGMMASNAASGPFKISPNPFQEMNMKPNQLAQTKSINASISSSTLSMNTNNGARGHSRDGTASSAASTTVVFDMIATKMNANATSTLPALKRQRRDPDIVDEYSQQQNPNEIPISAEELQTKVFGFLQKVSTGLAQGNGDVMSVFQSMGSQERQQLLKVFEMANNLTPTAGGTSKQLNAHMSSAPYFGVNNNSGMSSTSVSASNSGVAVGGLQQLGTHSNTVSPTQSDITTGGTLPPTTATTGAGSSTVPSNVSGPLLNPSLSSTTGYIDPGFPYPALPPQKQSLMFPPLNSTNSSEMAQESNGFSSSMMGHQINHHHAFSNPQFNQHQIISSSSFYHSNQNLHHQQQQNHSTAPYRQQPRVSVSDAMYMSRMMTSEEPVGFVTEAFVDSIYGFDFNAKEDMNQYMNI